MGIRTKWKQRESKKNGFQQYRRKDEIRKSLEMLGGGSDWASFEAIGKLQ